MDELNLEQYFARTLKRFKYHLSKARKDANAKSIHDFRVAYKQLIALQFFIEEKFDHNEKDKFKNWIDRVKPVYKKGGKLRDFQVIEKSCRNQNIVDLEPGFKEWLAKSEKDATHEFIAFAKKFRVASKTKLSKYIKHISSEDKSLNATSFYSSVLLKAISSIQEPASEVWHDARRQIKICYHLANSQIIGYSMTDDIRLNAKQLEQLLGDWHDYFTLQNYWLEYYNIKDERIDANIKLLEADISIAALNLKQLLHVD